MNKSWIYAIFPPRCPYCGILFPGGKICDSCEVKIAHFRNAYHFRTDYCSFYTAPFFYREQIRTAILKLRSTKSAETIDSFVNEMKQQLPHVKFDGVVFIPSYRFKKGGGSEISKLLAKKLSKEIRVPCLPNAVKKIRNTPGQHEVERIERYSNLKDCFRAREKDMSGKTILICDDVVTTGTTMNEVAKACKLAGAKRIYGVAVAISLIHQNRVQ